MDGERGAAILRQLDGALDRLEGYARDVDFTRFATEGLHQDGILRVMTLAAQCVIDLALLIVADRRFGTPPTYREAFDVLARNGVIPAEWTADLGRWASTRNVIVHLYTKLDLQELHRTYTTRTAVLRDFRAAVALSLSKTLSGVEGSKRAPSSAREPKAPYRKSTRPASVRKPTTNSRRSPRTNSQSPSKQPAAKSKER
jgi:uncharacterized protein YutE (UPF0331/DUF86 family)